MPTAPPVDRLHVLEPSLTQGTRQLVGVIDELMPPQAHPLVHQVTGRDRSPVDIVPLVGASRDVLVNQLPQVGRADAQDATDPEHPVTIRQKTARLLVRDVLDEMLGEDVVDRSWVNRHRLRQVSSHDPARPDEVDIGPARDLVISTAEV